MWTVIRLGVFILGFAFFDSTTQTTININSKQSTSMNLFLLPELALRLWTLSSVFFSGDYLSIVYFRKRVSFGEFRTIIIRTCNIGQWSLVGKQWAVNDAIVFGSWSWVPFWAALTVQWFVEANGKFISLKLYRIMSYEFRLLKSLLAMSLRK